MQKQNLTRNQITMEYIGDFVENRIGERIEKRYEAPVLEGTPKDQVWYRIPIPEGLSGDGSGYHIYLKKAESSHLCVFLSGGGVAWNEYTAARPVTGAKVAAGLPNYYWNNLRPFTQIMNINTGITELGNPRNPFDHWNIVVITYATGDFHVGEADFPYTAEDGSQQVLHFHGHINFQNAMKVGKKFFPDPDKLLIAGDSAGAFAVPAVTNEILENYYPECRDITLLSDSAQLLYRRWRRTAREVWGAPESVWEPLHSSNITVDWYRNLHHIWGERLRYLYAGSPRDYLLSSYYNDVANKSYTTNHDIQEIYFRQMRQMLKELKGITDSFGFFIYNFRNLRMMLGGTVHTIVRHRNFYFRTRSGVSMAEWLGNAVNGKIRDVGMEFVDSLP